MLVDIVLVVLALGLFAFAGYVGGCVHTAKDDIPEPIIVRETKMAYNDLALAVLRMRDNEAKEVIEDVLRLYEARILEGVEDVEDFVQYGQHLKGINAIRRVLVELEEHAISIKREVQG